MQRDFVVTRVPRAQVKNDPSIRKSRKILGGRSMVMRSMLLSGICTLLVFAKDRPPKVILSVIIDDMGFYDSRPTNPNSPTPTLNALAQEGVFLNRHYTYSYCSPTRRSFLTGRYPVHISGVQADVCDNWTPLNMSLLSNKLQSAGYEVPTPLPCFAPPGVTGFCYLLLSKYNLKHLTV